MFAEILGKLLFWRGEDGIIYGLRALIFHPQLRLDFEIPGDPRAGYGCPQLTDRRSGKSSARTCGAYTDHTQEMRTKLAGDAS